MSRVRMGEDSSDIYLYDDYAVHIRCCHCQIKDWSDGNWNVELHSVDDALAHIAAHRAAGHTVPEYVDVELERDRAELTAWLAP